MSIHENNVADNGYEFAYTFSYKQITILKNKGEYLYEFQCFLPHAPFNFLSLCSTGMEEGSTPR
jgi:hypothetical protein